MFGSPEKAKKRASDLERILKKHGFTVAYCDCRNAMAVAAGYDDWNILVLAFKKNEVREIDDFQFQTRLIRVLLDYMESDQAQSVVKAFCGSRYTKPLNLHRPIVMGDGCGMPSYGALVGTVASQDLIDKLNENSVYFGGPEDRFADAHRRFDENILEPIRKADAAVAKHWQERQDRIDQKIVRVRKQSKASKKT